MKSAKKSLLSCIFIFVFFVFLAQVFCIHAAADNAVTGDETLVYALYVPGGDGEMSVQVSGGDEDSLLQGKPYSVKFGGTELSQSAGGGFQLKDLLDEEKSLEISPPDGFYVERLFISPNGFDHEPAADLLGKYAVASPAGADISIPGRAFINESGSFNDSLLSSIAADGQGYTLYIQLQEIGTYDAPITVSYSVSGISGFVVPAGQELEGESVVAAVPNDASLEAAFEAKQQFSGWELRYSNGAGVIVKPGTAIAPYEPVTLSAVFEDLPQVMICANDFSATYGDGIAPTYTVDPEGLIDSSLISFTVTNEAGVEVTDPLYVGSYTVAPRYDGETHYEIDLSPGTLTVTPRELTVTADAPIADDAGNVMAGGYQAAGLLDGDELIDVTVSQPELMDGMYVCTPSGGTVIRGGADVTENYRIMYVPGQTEETQPDYVIPLPPSTVIVTEVPQEPGQPDEPNDSGAKTALVIKASDRTAVYSGQLICADRYEIVEGALAEGDSITDVTYTGGSVDVTGSAPTSVSSVRIVNANGEDVTAGYDLTFQVGTVKVTTCPLNIEVKELSRTYDGSRFEPGLDDLNVTGLISGFQLRVTFHVEGIGRVAGSTDVIEPGQYTVSVSDVQVLDASGADATKNFEISTASGILTISRDQASVQLTVTAPSGSWTYDGTEHTVEECTVSGLVDGDKVGKIVFSEGTNTITDAGSKEVIIASVQVLDAQGGDASGKYNLVLVPGVLSVSKASLTLTAESAQKAYDGKPLENKKVSATRLANSKHTLSVRFDVLDKDGNSTKAIREGTYTKKVTSYTVKDKDGNDVTANYDVKLIDGTLTVTAGTASPAPTDNNKRLSPATGDESNIGLWAVLLGVSAVVIIIVFFFILRSRRKK